MQSIFLQYNFLSFLFFFRLSNNSR